MRNWNGPDEPEGWGYLIRLFFSIHITILKAQLMSTKVSYVYCFCCWLLGPRCFGIPPSQPTANHCHHRVSPTIASSDDAGINVAGDRRSTDGQQRQVCFRQCADGRTSPAASASPPCRSRCGRTIVDAGPRLHGGRARTLRDDDGPLSWRGQRERPRRSVTPADRRTSSHLRPRLTGRSPPTTRGRWAKPGSARR